MAPFSTEFTRHLDDGSHGHGISDMSSAQGGGASQRTDIHNRSATCTQHPLASLLAHAKPTDNQVVQDLLEFTDGKFLRLSQDPIAGDIPEEIDAAKIAIHVFE